MVQTNRGGLGQPIQRDFNPTALQKARKDKHPSTRTKLPEKIKPSRLHFTPDRLWKRWRMSSHSEAALARRCYTAQSTTHRFLGSFETSSERPTLAGIELAKKRPTAIMGGSL